MRSRALAIATILALGLSLGACFADSQIENNLSMRFSMSDLGIKVDENAIRGWSNWLGTVQQPLEGEPFNLGDQSLNFYLGLRLSCNEIAVSLEGLGQSVSLLNENQEEILEIDLMVGPCTGGVFSAAIFWDEEGEVSTFTGTSQPADLPPVDGVPVGLDAYYHPTGKISCFFDSSGLQGEIEYSVVDLEENVRFAQTVDTANGGTQFFTLDHIPIGRVVRVEVKDASGAEKILADAVLVSYAGETVDGGCDQ
jgi:hypothetical protein